MNARKHVFCRLSYLFLVAFVAGQQVWADDPRPSISVSGTAKVLVTPDQAAIAASVTSRFATLDEAVTDNQKLVEQLRNYLRDAGIEAKHVQTSQISIQPLWPETDRRHAASTDFEDLLKKSQPIGYEATRSFQITIVDLTKFEQIYAGLLKSGVNSVGNVTFTSSKLREHRDTARLQAVRAAREKATAMAQELGAKLLTVKLIQEATEPRYQMAQNSFNDMSEAEGGWAPGQIEIGASVHVEFYLSAESLLK
jgi:uncharacterized protein